MILSDFLNWATIRGIELGSSIEVRESPLGGLGIFAKTSTKEDTVVLSIPKSSVFDLRNLLEFAEKLKKADNTTNAILNAALQAGGHDSETTIIRSFFWGFSMIKTKFNLSQESENFEIDAYLNVLLTTPTLDIDETECSDFLIQELISEKTKVVRDYFSLVKELPETESLMTFSQAFQLHQAVKSRVLEIPEAVNSQDEYEYSTNISMVPVLDFANHSHENNAVFDVDPESNDVILRIIKDVAPSEEVTISYDPLNSVNKFMKTYGFVPENPRVFIVPIPDIDALVQDITGHEDYTKIAKWLQIQPRLTMKTDKSGNVNLDTENSRLPLLLIPGLSYYKDWAMEITDIAEEFDESTENAGAIITELKKQEEHSPVIFGSDTAFGVTYKDSYISISNILEQTGTTSEVAIRRLAARTVELVLRAFSGLNLSVAHEIGHRGSLENYEIIRNEIFGELIELPKEEILHVIQSSIENLLE